MPRNFGKKIFALLLSRINLLQGIRLCCNGFPTYTDASFCILVARLRVLFFVSEEWNVNTYVPKRDEIKKKWLIIDADGKVLGRIAAEAASILRGKHKPMYTPYLDCGDSVVIINAEKVVLTGRKRTDKKYYRHSGYPGGIKETTYDRMLEKHPTRAMSLAVKGMLPHNRLGSKMYRHLRVYAGSEHPHEAQQPEPHR